MSILYSSLFSSLCSLLLILTFQLAKGENNTQNFHYFCDFNNRGNYTPNSPYAKNLNTLLSTLTSNTEITHGFYKFSQGQNTNKINAIGLCRGDINPDECRNCLTSSRANLTQLCPNQKEAIGWFEDELCMLRYSDRSIFNLMENGPAYYANNMSNPRKLDEFENMLMILLEYVRSQAAFGGSFIKYGAHNVSDLNAPTVYGLAQCTPDLSVSECSDCLTQSIDRIQLDCCKDKIGGRVVRPSCNMRFETSFLFFKPGPPPPPPPPPTSTTTNNNTSSQGKSNTTIGIAIAIPIAAAMVLIFISIYLRVRKPKRKFETQDDEIEISESLKFTFVTIRNATNDFSDSNKLGQGGFGVVYHGRLSNGQAIAVKRLSWDSGQGDLEFKNEVLLVAKLQHRNLVRLLGFCLEGRERLLVYEFVVNKSLDYFIFDQTKRMQLNWKRCYKIIVGIARGILYLHEDSRLRIIHRDLKASNILLDEDMNPKIADFGMARLFGVDQTQENTNRVVGTYGYMAPEYAMHGEFSVKSDVFSFGVLVLETISGRKSSGVRCADKTREYLLSFVWRNWREGLAKNIIDQTLNSDSVNEIMRCIHIGLLCVQAKATSRPTMASILLMLNSHSLTLSVPSEPAFHVDSGTENLQDMMQSWDFSALAQESINGASITEPYPR